MHLAPVPDAGQRNGRDAQVGGDVVLRYPLHDVGMLGEQLFVPLLRRILDAGQKQLLVRMEAVGQLLFVGFSQGSYLLDEPIEGIALDGGHFRCLYAF